MGSVPIIDRELRRLSRRPMTYHVRSGTAFAAALIGLGVITVSVGAGSNPAQMGRQLFSALTILALVFTLLAGPILTADCLSEEKRLGTLGMLFLTNLTGWDLVAGKLVALALPAVHCLLALLPILGLCFFIGGVTGGEFLRIAFVLAGTLFFSLSVAMLMSALSRDGRKAMAAAVLFIILVTIGLPGAELLARGGKFPADPVLLLTSPGYALWLTPEANYPAAARYFWTAVGVNHAVSWMCLAAAGFLLPATWQDRPALAKKNGWAAVLGDWVLRRRFEKERKEKLLELNPILWLASRSRRGAMGIWLFLIGSLALWRAGTEAVNARWLSADFVFIIIYCLHATLKTWIAWEASRRFAEDRNNGALELLLCTPLREEHIWQGWLQHLRRRFLAPVIALCVIDVALLDGGVTASGWWGGAGDWGVAFIAGMGLFIADTYTLSWVGLWQGLTARNSMRACLNCLLYILILPAAGTLGLLGMFGLVSASGSMGSLGAMVAFWFTVGFLVDFIMCGRAMSHLSRDFRAASIHGVSSHRRSWRWWDGPGAGEDEFIYPPVRMIPSREEAR